MLSAALGTYGSWLDATKLQSPETITEKYLLPAVEMAEKSTVAEAVEKAYHTVAQFADEEYERLKVFIKSSEFQDKLNLHRIQLQQEAELSSRSDAQSSSYKSYRRTLEHNREVNELEIDSIKAAFLDNMLRAITNHIRTMENGSSYDLLSVFRLVAIWFENESRNDIRSTIQKCVPGNVQSHKFLPLMCQMTARLSMELSPLQQTLKTLIIRAAKEHPHHVIPMLFALKNAATDLARGSPPEETLSRANAAKQLLKMVGEDNPQLVRDYNAFTSALIQLANAPKGSVMLNPSSFKLATLSDLQNAHVLTHRLNARPSCDYTDVPHVYRYSQECKSAGGVNEPKIIFCVGSDGRRYKQLCKGRDDARQDAVMQQVFLLVNELFRAEQSTQSMNIRTYQVIPLSQRSGLLEWCEGTTPVGIWLGSTTAKGAHTRYHPEAWSVSKCREKMKAFKRSWSDEEFTRAYLDICKNLPPVLRHFFFERFKEAESWLNARHSYSQSVATSSMVGYVLGIGDRHTNNMLLDEKTGELIHIDFGVAFDRGKVLPIPETIPFRLSRDIVDGFGPTGVDGAFRRCCEKTLTVLRSSDRIISTILQVLIDDPLLDWTLSAEKLQEKQKKQARTDTSIVSQSVTSNSTTLTEAITDEDRMIGYSVASISRQQMLFSR
ncbi:serine-protein kinase ATM-like isoform X2 [Watersipora subatra]|uniref:serine-protein kinase ATM-like isoform X2 n=1 Tax=Watersipora subatra TaxID=2589382 RepID=UPI00355B2861